MLFPLAERYGIESKLACAAMRLARQVPAKAVAGGLTVGEVQQRRGIRKSTDIYDRLVDDRPEIAKHGIDSAAPARHEIREEAGHVVWALEGLDLMIARHGLPADSVEDSLVSLDRIHAAALRIVRTIEVQGLLHPALAYITGRGPRRRAARRARKAVAPWEVEEAAPEGQGAKASRKQKRRPPAKE
jgi:hypothetical protein